jgi:flagellar hook-associated protein 2
MASPISFGGLASGLDTNLIIDKLVEIESATLTKLQKRQSGVKAQVSALGDIASRLGALETAAKDLASGGVLGLKTTSTNTAFSAAPGSGGAAGSYRIQVTELAQAAKARSTGFAAGELVAAGTFAFTVQGKSFSVNVGDPVAGTPATLDDVAAALRSSGAAISAVVLDDGTNRYLSVTSTATGHPLGGVPGDALSLTHTATGATGKALAMGITQPAVNAQFTIDGLAFTRSSNTVSDALPGTTLTLKVKGGAAEDLVVANDADATKAKLQTFADAYNAVFKLLQGELQTTANTDRGRTLNGDSTLRFLQGRLQSLVSTVVPGTGTVRSLADLGLKTSSGNGSLSIDSAVLGRALDRDPAAVNALFSTAGTGVQALTSGLTQAFTRAGDGVLTSRKASLDDSVKRMDRDVERLQARLETYRATLVKRYGAMEDAVSKIKSSGTYLTSQWNALSKKE